MTTDLRKWLAEVDKLGELAGVDGAHPKTEIGALSSLNYRRPDPKALLFDNIPGYPAGYRVLTASLSNARRMGLTMRLGNDFDDRALMAVLPAKTREWAETARNFAAVEIANAPFQENRQSGADIDLSIFPTPTWHEFDGGPYIGTGDICITTDPDSGVPNAGSCRVQVQEGGKSLTVQMSPVNDTAINVRKWMARDGKAPMAISMGNDPLMLLVGGSIIPREISEFDYAGAILGTPVEYVAGAETGLPIPVCSEIVVEGWLIEGETLTEGPFGESKGYYSRVKQVQSMQIANVYYRNQPIILGSPPGKPPYDYSYMKSVMKSALVMESLEKAGVPAVKDVWVHETGRVFIVVAISQQYAGHSRQAAAIASNCREGAPSNKYVVVVDEDINPRNLDEVAWAMCTRSDPEVDIDIMRKTWGSHEDPLRRDPTADYMSRALIDACKPYGMLTTYPKVADYRSEILDEVRKKWPHLV